MLDPIALYMPFLILTSVNNFVLKKNSLEFGSTMMGTTIFWNKMSEMFSEWPEKW